MKNDEKDENNIEEKQEDKVQEESKQEDTEKNKTQGFAPKHNRWERPNQGFKKNVNRRATRMPFRGSRSK